MPQWIEKQRYYLDYILSSLSRRKAKNGSLLLVYVLIVFLLCSVMFFAAALRREAVGLLENAPEIVVQKSIAGRPSPVALAEAEVVRSIRGVQSVQARLWGYYYHPASRANYTLMVAGPSDAFQPGEAEVVVGQGVLRSWKGIQGDQLVFKVPDGEVLTMKVAQAFSASTDLVSSDLILMGEAPFRRITGMPEGYVTDLAVSVRNKKECPTIAEKIGKAIPSSRPILRQEIQRTYDSLFEWRSGYVVVLLTGAVAAFFIFAWDKATGLSAEEKHEIGVLKAVGWDTADVLAMKLWEGFLLSSTAFVMGVLLAYLHVYFLSATLFEHALKGWSIVYPEFRLNPVLDVYQIGTLFFLTVLPYAFVTMLPVWKVSITDPAVVLR
jgi:ABC-type lipoprotein release transport system permease subunit